MAYLGMLFVLCSGYYALTYGLSLWKNENKPLAGISSIAVAIIGTIVPIIVLFIFK